MTTQNLLRRLTLRLNTYTRFLGLPIPHASASAFALDARTVITNRHCVDEVDCAGFKIKGATHTPNRITTPVKGLAPDLAVVRYAHPQRFPQVTLSEKLLEKGDTVWFVDSRHGVQARKVTAIRPTTHLRDHRLGQFTGTVSAGTSGSPLFDENGHVVGLIYGEVQQRKTSAPEGQFIMMSDLMHHIHD